MEVCVQFFQCQQVAVREDIGQSLDELIVDACHDTGGQRADHIDPVQCRLLALKHGVVPTHHRRNGGKQKHTWDPAAVELMNQLPCSSSSCLHH